MANKRMLKKGINAVCGDIAGICLFSEASENLDSKAVADVILDVAALQEDSRKKVTISFDKSTKEYASIKEYKKAKSAYYKAAYNALISQLNEQLQEIIKRVNALTATTK